MTGTLVLLMLAGGLTVMLWGASVLGWQRRRLVRLLRARNGVRKA